MNEKSTQKNIVEEFPQLVVTYWEQRKLAIKVVGRLKMYLYKAVDDD